MFDVLTYAQVAFFRAFTSFSHMFPTESLDLVTVRSLAFATKIRYGLYIYRVATEYLCAPFLEK